MIVLQPIQYFLGALSGSAVGFTLGLVGGGGSILAVPLMVYVVGVSNPHMAIGTSAFAVAANAASGLAGHARVGTVKWRCGLTFAATGVVGAVAGSTAGKALNGSHLLLFFAFVMILVGAMMLHGRKVSGIAGADLNRTNAPKVLATGLLTGLFSGFFGIGGGFLIVPGLIASTRMPMLDAVGTALVAVTAFGLTTAFNYALSGLVNWPLAFVFIAGGFIGGLLGSMASHQLSERRGLLTTMFSFAIFLAAGYVIWRAV